MKGMLRIRGIVSIVTMVLLAVFLTACGGDGDGGITAQPNVREGIFVDSPVDGVAYSTPTQSGVTDSEGNFNYLEGESVTFTIGTINLGQELGRERLTPCNLVAGASDETHPTVTNICRLIISLDVDGDFDNGITISSEIRTEAEGKRSPLSIRPRCDGDMPDAAASFCRVSGTITLCCFSILPRFSLPLLCMMTIFAG